MSTKKTIQINPELFRLPSNKTRKVREKKEINLVPIVSPNSLKNKLLKRIKEHKSKEFNTKINTESYTPLKNETNKEYEDEFYGAINYLSDLAKKQKLNAEKERYQRNLNNKTLKQWTAPSINKGEGSQFTELGSENIALNLPPELQPLPLRSNFIPSQKNNSDIMNIKYRADNDIPYGCLKGGVKPSYKSWIQTRKNYEHPELENLPSVRPPTPPKRNTFVDDFSQRDNINSITAGIIKSNSQNNTTNISRFQSSALSREERLEQIKNKLRLLQEQENGHKPEFKSLKEDLSILQPIINEYSNKINNESSIPISNHFEIPDIFNDVTGGGEEISNNPKDHDSSKKYIKKTIKRKFTLGKSSKMRKVGVLIKDNRTRKNIVNAQKDLKKADISDVRKYLRKHGIIKVGSTAPPDVLRKTFECAMMTGDITNTNKDVLLHNFIHEQN